MLASSLALKSGVTIDDTFQVFLFDFSIKAETRQEVLQQPLLIFLQLNESKRVGLHLQRNRAVFVSRREDLRVETHLVRQMACRVSQ